MATLGKTRFGITTKFSDTNQNTVSKTYNGLNLIGSAGDATLISSFFVAGGPADSVNAGFFDLLGTTYTVQSVDRNMNNEVILS